MSRPARIFISAGEASGDRLGAGLAKALLERRPDLELLGMGGPLMRASGVRLIQDASEVAVVGIVEVLARLPAIRAAMGRLEGSLEDDPPDLLVPIDFPDFNLDLAGRAGRVGVPVVYFVSPQVWAWRRGRVKKIRERVRRMLVLFRFETKFYEEAGVPVTFVGHPVVEALEGAVPVADLLSRAGIDPERPAVALMPGSRRGEVERLLGPMIEAAGRVRERLPETQFLVPLAPALDETPVREALDGGGLSDARIHRGDFPQIVGTCDAGVVASGTASLEAAAEGLPLVVVYRVNALTHLLGRMLVRLDHVALPNLVAGRRLVPELIQRDCTAERIAAELLRYLENPAHAQATREALQDLRGFLGAPGAFGRAADAVLEELASLRR